eukprot:768272-Hanusia_phi.AAC.15
MSDLVPRDYSESSNATSSHFSLEAVGARWRQPQEHVGRRAMRCIGALEVDGCHARGRFRLG